MELRKRKRLKRREYQSKGPNYMWHVDGYDKLKPYGLCINGCVDGFSRKIVWLEVYCTNNDPRIMTGYFLHKVEDIGGCPRFVRGDYGTENSSIAAMQNTFNEGGFIYGPSTSNTRIERLWGSLRTQCMQFWIELFGKLKDDRHFSGSYLEVNILRFCFMTFIQVCLL